MCLSPELSSITAVATYRAWHAPLPRLRSLARFLEAHAACVRSLTRDVNVVADLRDGVVAPVGSCLAACSAAGCLEELSLQHSPLPAIIACLTALTALRSLELWCLLTSWCSCRT